MFSETDTEDNEPVNNIKNFWLIKNQLLVKWIQYLYIGDTSDINGKSANEKPTVKNSDTNICIKMTFFCFVTKKANFKIASHLKTHLVSVQAQEVGRSCEKL